jgi:pimeloyl-ACP methyl ester carboxylesterase
MPLDRAWPMLSCPKAAVEPSLDGSAAAVRCATAWARPQLRRLESDTRQRYWVSMPRPRPTGGGQSVGVLVSVHGISRNAGAHARALASVSDELGLVLVAPHFSRSRFPDYQRLGRPGRLGAGGRADTMLLRIVETVRVEFGLARQPFLLVGHSGGAQFALRFAVTHADHVAGYVLSAPGSYCWPDEARRFPAGVGRCRSFSDLHPSLGALLALPGLVLVGSRDVSRDDALRQGGHIDALQGPTRVERARRWVAAMNACSTRFGNSSAVRLEIVEGYGHSFGELARSQAWYRALSAHLAEHRSQCPPPR